MRCSPYADAAYLDRTKKEDSEVDYTILPDNIETCKKRHHDDCIGIQLSGTLAEDFPVERLWRADPADPCHLDEA